MLQSAETLSPARKAWATRKARADARNHIAAVKHGVATPSPVGDSPVVTLDWDDSPCGPGRRHYVVLDLGTKHVGLFYSPTLEVARIDRVTFDRIAVAARGVSRRRLSAYIRQKMEQWQQFYPNDCERALARAKRAIAALRG
jgi:hypothetical protein